MCLPNNTLMLNTSVHAGTLRAEYEREAAARQAAEDAAERASVERQRLQRARDELAANLLVALPSSCMLRHNLCIHKKGVIRPD